MKFWRGFTKLVRKKRSIQITLGVLVMVIFAALAIWSAMSLFAEEEVINNIGTLYYQESGTPKSVNSNQASTQIIDKANTAPSIISVNDYPIHYPIDVGAPVNFQVNWSDSGDQVRIYICKTNIFSTSSRVCSGGSWCSSASFSASSPGSCQYIAQKGDARTSPNRFYAYACDDEGLCSTSGVSGSFIVNDPTVSDQPSETPTETPGITPTEPGRKISYLGRAVAAVRAAGTGGIISVSLLALAVILGAATLIYFRLTKAKKS